MNWHFVRVFAKWYLVACVLLGWGFAPLVGVGLLLVGV